MAIIFSQGILYVKRFLPEICRLKSRKRLLLVELDLYENKFLFVDMSLESIEDVLSSTQLGF